MSKRKKATIITLIVLAAIYFLLIGADYFFLRWFVFPTFEERRLTGEFPFSSAAIPSDYAEYAIQGLKLNALTALKQKQTMQTSANISAMTWKNMIFKSTYTDRAANLKRLNGQKNKRICSTSGYRPRMAHNAWHEKDRLSDSGKQQ